MVMVMDSSRGRVRRVRRVRKSTMSGYTVINNSNCHCHSGEAS
jgi:hypothetical protein